MMEHLRRFYLKFSQWLLEVNSDALRRKSVRSANSETVSRNFGASADALEIHHAVRDKSWHPGILNPKNLLARHSGEGRNPARTNTPRSWQTSDVDPLSRGILNQLDSGLRRNDEFCSNGLFGLKTKGAA